jgi:dolichol-phosphate mannosyltransferase
VEGKAKLMATKYARDTARTRRKPILTLRLFSVFGPLDHPRRLVPQVIASALSSTPLRASCPDVARDYLYVEDVADLYLRAMTAAAGLGGEILNAGSGRATTAAELIEAVGVLVRRELDVHWGAFPLAAHDLGCWAAEVTKLHTLLQWQPRFALEDGLRAMLRWARRQPRRLD